MPMTTADTSRALDPRLERLFGALDEAGLRWCLLRPPETLAADEGDVDILIAPEDVDAVRRVASSAGLGLFRRGGRDLHAVDYDDERDALLWVHLQPEVSLAGGALPARLVLDRVVRDPLPRPVDATLFWVLLLHVLDKGAIAERHRPALQRLARSSGVADCALAAVAARRGVAPERAVALARAADWHGLTQLAPAGVPLRARLQGRLRGLRERRGQARARGLTVTVLGPDGAGKTTLVTSLNRTLPLPTRTIYMGLTGGWLPLADALRVPGLVFVARLAILGGRYLRGQWHRARGRIVMFERYTLDGYVPSGMRLHAPGRLSRRAQAATFPPPDLVLLLDAPGQTLFRRSHEYDAERLENWRQAFRRLEERIDALVVLDAEQPREVVRRQAQAEILQHYAELWNPPT